MNELNLNIDSRHIAVIGSHKDETGKSDGELKDLFYQTIKDKPYQDTLINCHICDLTNEKELRKVVNDIFGKTIFTK